MFGSPQFKPSTVWRNKTDLVKQTTTAELKPFRPFKGPLLYNYDPLGIQLICGRPLLSYLLITASSLRFYEPETSESPSPSGTRTLLMAQFEGLVLLKEISGFCNFLLDYFCTFFALLDVD